MLLPPPGRRIPLMIGSNGERMLSIALPHVDWWNTWYASYGNTVEGFAELNGRITEAAERAGRDPAEVAAKHCGARRARPGRRQAAAFGRRLHRRSASMRCAATSRRSPMPALTRRS